MKLALLALAALTVTTPAPAADRPQGEVASLFAISEDLKKQAQLLYDIATDCEFCADDYPERAVEQPWFCEDYEAEGEAAPKGCLREPGRESRVERESRLMCTGPTEVIADDDPALAFFRRDEGLSLETRKEALAMTRAGCD